ncbi:MAG: hypothetical protein KatS3mg117_1488 [Geminicoccaceae bacterium]|nr:MAG: hypothetical protein KatS3mg117_1488 [Geminicoccaceae bacterium]
MSEDGAAAAASEERPAKASTAFRTISEVAEELGVAQHVLRFWETKFPAVRPLKRGGGRRYYRPEDVELLRRIRKLLYEEGYTIKGAQKALRATRAGTRTARPSEPAAGPSGDLGLQLGGGARQRLLAIRAELEELRTRLRRALA